MNKRWLIVACGASLVVSTPGIASGADRVTGLEIKAEARTKFRASAFPSARSSVTPFIVSLREAWESGANSWSAARRNAFGADPSVRAPAVVLSSRANVQRADRDPSQWLPARSLRCAYISNWISVKLAWGLAADPAEVSRLRRVVASCPAASTTTTTSTMPSASSPAATTNRSTGATSGSTSGSTTTSLQSVSDALSELAKVKIAPEYTAGYDRSLFPHWKDLDGDGCDTRKEVLIRDSRRTPVVGASCTVTSGEWYSQYDGESWTNPSDVDIDHVVALNEAWQSGAYAWTTQQRTNYANDLSDARTLLAVTDSVNQSKSDKDPTEWLPPLASYRCTYLANWVSVKVRWSLTMDEAEYTLVKSALSSCGATVAASPTFSTQTPAVSTVTTTASAAYVTPGAFCSPFGATGVSEKGTSYSCKPSATDSRNRWRR